MSAEAPAATALDRWLASQARREERALRLEDALLADRYAGYFVFRLRFFVARVAIAGAVHAIRVALLFAAFARDEFLVLVLVGAGVAIVGDAWWGGLEGMRGRIRHLQRVGAGHLVPREIATWLRLATRCTGVGLVLAGVGLAWVLMGTPDGAGPPAVLVCVMVAGAALDLTVRAYHSGVYALRRVYRPLPSLIAVDVVSVGTLLVLYPLIDTWSFVAAELLSTAVVLGISLRYTANTYRTLGLPALPALLRLPTGMPSRGALLGAIAPALAYGTVGLEGLVLLAAVAATASTEGDGSAALVALLAALGPVVRAGFEWARLLYFDLVRLGLPMLVGLRRRFDRAVLRLAGLMGALTWLIATIVGVVVLGIRDPALIAVLLPFFVARSVLAAAQMRSFAGGAFRRLTLVGIAGLAGFAAVLLAVPDIEGRLLSLALVLAVSAVLLVTLPEPPEVRDRVWPLVDWLAGLRATDRPVRVTSMAMDDRWAARGVTREARRAAGWRRRQAGRRIGLGAVRAGGAATWTGPTELTWWLPADASAPDDPWAVELAGGLAVDPPRIREHPDGASAAAEMASRLGVDPATGPLDAEALAGEFGRRFPAGLLYAVDRPPPPGLVRMNSRDRAGVLRAALRFVRDLDAGRHPGPYEVTALADATGLRLLFLVDRRAPGRERRRWRLLVRDQALLAAVSDAAPRRAIL